MGENSKEREIVLSLYRDGRITEQQRDELLSALEADGSVGDVQPQREQKHEKTESKTVVFLTSGVENPYDSSTLATAISSIDGVKNVVADIKRARVTVKGRFDVDSVIASAKVAGFSIKPVGVDYDSASAENGVSRGINEEVEREIDGAMEELDEELEDLEKELDELNVEINEQGENSGSKFDVNLGCGEEEEEDEDEEEEEDNGPLYKKFRVFSEKVADATNKGIESAKHWGVKLGETIGNALAAQGIFGDTVIKSKPEKSDVPYEDMEISVKYVGGNVVANYIYEGSKADKLKEKMRPIMSKETYTLMCEKIDEKFVGKFKYVCGSDVLKMRVAPSWANEDND